MPHVTRLVRRAALAPALLLVSLLASGCMRGDEPDAGATAVPPATVGTARTPGAPPGEPGAPTPPEDPGGTSATGGLLDEAEAPAPAQAVELPDGFPPGFPFPDGFTVSTSGPVGVDVAVSGAYQGTIEEAAAFYRDSLPAAGYEVTSTAEFVGDDGNGLATFDIAGAGVRGTVAVRGDATGVTIGVTLSPQG